MWLRSPDSDYVYHYSACYVISSGDLVSGYVNLNSYGRRSPDTRFIDYSWQVDQDGDVYNGYDYVGIVNLSYGYIIIRYGNTYIDKLVKFLYTKYIERRGIQSCQIEFYLLVQFHLPILVAI